jgi:hypothetical protein
MVRARAREEAEEQQRKDIFLQTKAKPRIREEREGE